jgi:hypothetical protein
VRYFISYDEDKYFLKKQENGMDIINTTVKEE